MYSDNNEFKIVIPEGIIDEELNQPKSNKTKSENIKLFKQEIKNQYNVLMNFRDVTINENNKEQIEKLIFATEDLIDNCISDVDYAINRDQNFVSLMYIYQRILLRKETYKLDKEIQQLEQKNKELNDYQAQIEERQSKEEEKNNNLVYNLLGFLTSFSIVSAVVAAINEIHNTIEIALFVSFTTLILLTTLIALHNFYKSNNKRETKLQDNYFLWKIVATIVIILVIILGINELIKNKDKFESYIDNKVNKIIEQKVNKELEIVIEQS